MANENRFDSMFKTSFENIKSMLDSNTVVGNPISLSNGTTIIPISKLSVGFATGGLDTGAQPKKANKFGGGGGSGMSISPVGFLVIDKNGKTEFVNIEAKNVLDPVEQACDLLDRSPEIIQKIKNIFDGNTEPKGDVKVEEIVK
ncbi:MAG: sporulation protein YtfJ [Clostridia bacterium]|nr:sporulation protein YtfJ [Clostridia bacterium]